MRSCPRANIIVLRGRFPSEMHGGIPRPARQMRQTSVAPNKFSLIWIDDLNTAPIGTVLCGRYLDPRLREPGAEMSSSAPYQMAQAVIFCLALCCTLATACTAIAQSDAGAQDAVANLKKLDAKVEIGISYTDYLAEVGSVNYMVSTVIDRDGTAISPAAATALKGALRWHRAAATIWSEQLKAAVPVGFCSATTLAGFAATALCKSYPELITSIPGDPPQRGGSHQFSVALVHFNAILAAQAAQLARESELRRSPGVIYELAVQEAWARASGDIDNAVRSLAGRPLVKRTDSSFELGQKAELGFLHEKAVKFQNRQK